jgi:hypothetical protein
MRSASASVHVAEQVLNCVFTEKSVDKKRLHVGELHIREDLQKCGIIISEIQ